VAAGNRESSAVLKPDPAFIHPTLPSFTRPIAGSCYEKKHAFFKTPIFTTCPNEASRFCSAKHFGPFGALGCGGCWVLVVEFGGAFRVGWIGFGTVASRGNPRTIRSHCAGAR
jgi:hypothetical protein